MPKKKPLYIPLASVEVTSAQLSKRFASFSKKKNSVFLAVETPKVSEPMLLVAVDSPQRVLLRPLHTGKDNKKAKRCCDKSCSQCTIPMRSSFTIGYFAHRRILKALKQEKWAAKFFTRKTRSALDKIGIQVYTAVSETPKRSAKQMKV
ncbi:MAG: hypothetical protein AAF649_07610 [Verrucomicrobiota bacterium]